MLDGHQEKQIVDRLVLTCGSTRGLKLVSHALRMAEHGVAAMVAENVSKENEKWMPQ